MKHILTIARFEWRYHQRRPVTYLFAGLVFVQGLWAATGVPQVYPGSDATATAYLILSSLGVALAGVTVLLAGQSLSKDWAYRTAPYLYALPVTSRSYFAGRFLGTYATALTLAVFYPLGALTLPLFYPSPAGQLPWVMLADGFVRLISQNVFIVVSIAYSLTVFGRNIRGAYIALFLIVLYFLLTGTQTDDGTTDDLWRLLDPFGVGMTRESVEAMMQTDGADDLFVFSDMLLINRLLWLGLSLGLLKQAEAVFTFQNFGQPPATRRNQLMVSGDTSGYKPPPVGRDIWPMFDGWSRVGLVGRLTKLAFLTLVRQPVFQLTAALLVVLTLLLATVFGQNADFPDLPLTARMTALRVPMGAFIGLFLLVVGGELFFQERTVGLWAIMDALPQPAFVRVVANWLALGGVATLLTVMLLLTGVGIQLSHAFTDIDWRLYAVDLIIDGFLRYCQWIVLGGFIAVLVNDRFVSHLISSLLFLTLWLSNQSGFGANSPYLYSFLPGSGTYSDLTGYGANGSFRSVVHLMWWGAAGIFGTLALLLWNRGTPTGLPSRVRSGRHRFAWPHGLALLLSATLFGFGLWRVRDGSTALLTDAAPTNRIRIKTAYVTSVSGRPIRLQVAYYHPYQVGHILAAAQSALRRGEQLFGPYPYPGLQIREVPHGSNAVAVGSSPGNVFISERNGWTADHRQPAESDYIDYLISRELANQWLTHRMRPLRRPGDGFLRQSLAEYLALRIVAEQYGTARLKHRLAQRTVLYNTARNRTGKPEPTLLRSSGNDALERGRAALVLASIGQVWGDSLLSRSIGQFYRQAVRKPASATATAFTIHLRGQLPDSLRYLTTYLSDRLWFNFSIGRIANLPNGLSVEIVPKKWRSNALGQRQSVPINDYVPIAVLDHDGRSLLRVLVHPNPDERFVQLPAMPTAAAVVIDPLGTWLETNKRDNRKIL